MATLLIAEHDNSELKKATLNTAAAAAAATTKDCRTALTAGAPVPSAPKKQTTL